MSSQTPDKNDPGSADLTAKPPYPALEIKKLSPEAALEWLESKSSSSDATPEQIEELKRCVRALIPEKTGSK